MSLPFLSFVVPVYNVANYVYDCLKSITDTELSEDLYEVIVLNDGSTDQSAQVVQQFMAEQPQAPVRYYEFPNSGVSAMRNQGISLARGQYVWFVDSDDTIEPKTVTSLVQQVRAEKPDLLYFGFRYIYEKGYQKEPFAEEQLPFKTGRQNIEQFFGHLSLLTSVVWSSLYSTQFLREQHLTFVSGLYFEDVEFVCRTFSVAQTLSFSPEKRYNYFVHGSSIVRNPQFTDKRIHDRVTIGLLVLQNAQATISVSIKQKQKEMGTECIRFGLRQAAATDKQIFYKLRHKAFSSQEARTDLFSCGGFKGGLLMRICYLMPVCYRFLCLRILPKLQ